MSIEFISFFIILLAGLFLSGIFNRLHLPWVAGLMIAGIIAGPYGLSLFSPTNTLEFIAEIGLVFLMFMAGLETRLHGFGAGYLKSILILAILTTTIPFATGFLITSYFGYDLLTALLIGIVFISSSVAVIIPSMQTNGLLGTRVGKTIMGATVIADVLSLTLLSFLLQSVDPITTLPLPLFYLILFAALAALRYFIPKVRTLFHYLSSGNDVFEREVRLIFTIMIGTVVLFQFLGLHAIIAGFFAGFILSDTIDSAMLKEKLHALAYGIFIPTFFVIVGANTNIAVFHDADTAGAIVFAVIGGLLLAKGVSGYIAGRVANFTRTESKLIGIATTPQLSTTLAALFTGFSIGFVDDALLATMIILSIVTTLVAPFGINRLAGRLHRGR